MLIAAGLAAGCTLATPAVGPSPKPGPGSTKTSAKPRKAPKLPERINLLMPASLGLVAAGGGNLIGPDGATLIGNDAASLVAAGGGNLVAAKAAPAFRVTQADCPPATTGQGSFLELVRQNASIYVDTAKIVNGILRGAMGAGLAVDEPLTFTPAGGEQVTAVLEMLGEADGILHVAAGSAYAADREILSLAFDSATKGRVLYRPLEPRPDVGRLVIASRFDLVAGEVSADGLADGSEPGGAPGPKSRAHWEFRAPRDAEAGAPAFTMQVAAAFHLPDAPCDSGPRGMTVHFLADGRGAARMGRVPPGQAELAYTRNDGNGYAPEPGPDTAFFLSAKGEELPAPDADDALRAVLPGRDDFYRPFPPDPGVGDPFADPTFAAAK
jgi:hypothetical protein